MKRTMFLILVLLASPALGQVLASADGSLQVLRVPVDARSSALGEAFGAVADDPGAVYWNPAGLSQVRRAAASLSYDSWLVDSSIQEAGLAFPTAWGTLGLRAAYVGYGTFEQRDVYGNLLSQSLRPDAFSLSAAFGTEIEFFSLGAALRYSSETLGTYELSGVGGDVGLLVPVEKFRFAAGVRGLDISSTYRSSADIYGGASYPLDFEESRLLVCLEGDLDGSGRSNCGQGLEFMFRKTLFLRGGVLWDLGSLPGVSNARLTGGIGVALQDISLDYAVADHGELGIVNRVTLGLRFGGALPQPVKVKKEKEPEEDRASVPDIQVLPSASGTPDQPPRKTRRKNRDKVILAPAPEPTPVPKAKEKDEPEEDYEINPAAPAPTLSLDDGSIKDITPR